MRADLIFFAVYLMVLVNAAPSTIELSKNVIWYCKTICNGCGGKSHFDFDIPACICKIDEHVDDGIVEVMKQAAKAVKLNINLLYTKNATNYDENYVTNTTQTPKNNLKHLDNIAKTKRDIESDEDISTSSTNKPSLKALIPLRKLQSRFHVTNHTDSILGHMNPNIRSRDSIFNLAHINPSLRTFTNHNSGVLGQLTPGINNHDTIRHGIQTNAIQPAITRALLNDVKNKLDGLILRSSANPYDRYRTAMDAHSLSNQLKQITQVNVNIKPESNNDWFGGTKLFHNLNGGMVGQNAPTLSDSIEESESIEEVKKIKSRLQEPEIETSTQTHQYHSLSEEKIINNAFANGPKTDSIDKIAVTSSTVKIETEFVDTNTDNEKSNGNRMSDDKEFSDVVQEDASTSDINMVEENDDENKETHHTIDENVGIENKFFDIQEFSSISQENTNTNNMEMVEEDVDKNKETDYTIAEKVGIENKFSDIQEFSSISQENAKTGNVDADEENLTHGTIAKKEDPIKAKRDIEDSYSSYEEEDLYETTTASLFNFPALFPRIHLPHSFMQKSTDSDESENTLRKMNSNKDYEDNTFNGIGYAYNPIIPKALPAFPTFRPFRLVSRFLRPEETEDRQAGIKQLLSFQPLHSITSHENIAKAALEDIKVKFDNLLSKTRINTNSYYKPDDSADALSNQLNQVNINVKPNRGNKLARLLGQIAPKALTGSESIEEECETSEEILTTTEGKKIKTKKPYTKNKEV